MQWLRKHNCPWDEDTCTLEVLKWAREHGCPWDSETCAVAADNGHW